MEAVRRATEELNESMQKIGQAVYGQPDAEGAEPGATEEAPEGTVEGEFREV